MCGHADPSCVTRRRRDHSRRTVSGSKNSRKFDPLSVNSELDVASHCDLREGIYFCAIACNLTRRGERDCIIMAVTAVVRRRRARTRAVNNQIAFADRRITFASVKGGIRARAGEAFSGAWLAFGREDLCDRSLAMI